MKLSGGKWRGIAFVASNKRVLERVLREKGALVTPQARAALDGLPETFAEWLAQPEIQEAAE